MSGRRRCPNLNRRGNWSRPVRRSGGIRSRMSERKQGRPQTGCPGTGKTSTILDYIERLLAAHVEPEDICFTSFTKAAVEEARSRVQARFGLQRDRLPLFGTLHSLAYRRLQLQRSNVFGRKDW